MKYFNRECELDSKQLKLQVCEGCVTLDTDVLIERATSLLQDWAACRGHPVLSCLQICKCAHAKSWITKDKHYVVHNIVQIQFICNQNCAKHGMPVVITDYIYVILYFRKFANHYNQTLISVKHVGKRNVSICLQPTKKKREKCQLLLIAKLIHKLCQLIIHSICFPRLSRTNLNKLDYLSWKLQW